MLPSSPNVHRQPFAPLRWLHNASHNVRQSIKERFTPAATAIPARWHKAVSFVPTDQVCLMVTVLRDGRVLPHAAHQARAWSAEGFKVVLIVVTDDPNRSFSDPVVAFADGILLRANSGYDFGAWSAAIQSLPTLRDVALLVTTNDSVFGPLDSFKPVLDRVADSEADFLALTENNEHRHHFQSYTLFYKPKALRSRAFWSFWSRVRTGGRWLVIVRYESRLLKLFKAAGLSAEALFPGMAAQDPSTLKGWKALIERGFPFVKVQLLRDNPFGDDVQDWRGFLQAHGYDPALCDPVLPNGAALTRWSS